MLASRTAVTGILVAALASFVILVAIPRTSSKPSDAAVRPDETRSWAQEIAFHQELAEVRRIIDAEEACQAEISKIFKTCSYTEIQCDREEDLERIRTLLAEAQRLGTIATAKLRHLRH
jgi:hypothetical protein